MNGTVSSEEARVLRFDGIHNFRDCGDYAAAGGNRVRPHWLYRSAQHKDATAEDLARVADLGLAAVIDLRSDREREVAPCPRPDGFAGKVLFVPDDEAGAAPHIEAARNVTDPASAVGRMTAAYVQIALRPGFLRAVRHYFEQVADAEGPVLIHCMAGKDRTGLAVAMLHRALGVAEDDWMADYLLTNEAGNVEARIAAGAPHVRAAFGRDLGDDALRVLMTVRPEFLQAGFAAIDEHYGSLDRYFAAAGMGEELIGKVRERLLA